KPSQRLVADLGFDSLMIVELAGKASDAFPGLKGLPKTLFAGETTIGDVVGHVRGVVRGARKTAAEPAQTEAAVAGRWIPAFVERPLAAQPQDAILPFAGKIAMLADRGGVGDALAKKLREAGIEIVDL